MKSRVSRSKGDSRKTSRQESSKGSSVTNSASNVSLHSPGSMTDNVSHTLQQKANQGTSLDRRIATARSAQVEPQDQFEQEAQAMAEIVMHEETKAFPEGKAAIDQESGKGMPLESNIREHLEESVGVDFSNVRIHTDSNAQALSDAIEADAFTTEQGSYNPGTQGGQELHAHESVHLIQ